MLGNQFIQSLLSSSRGMNDWLGNGMGGISQAAGIFAAGSERNVEDPERALDSTLAEVSQHEAALAEAEHRLTEYEAQQAVAESGAKGWWSDDSILISQAEAEQIVQVKRLVQQTQQRCQALRSELEGLRGRAVGLEEQIHSEQRYADSFAEIISEAEKLDTSRDIVYSTRFKIDEEDIYNSERFPATDPDQGIKSQLERGWASDRENCCIYVLHTLEEAGYDLDAQVEVGGSLVTVRRLVLIHAKTLLTDNRDGLSDVAQDPTHRYHPVLKGVVTALTRSNQGEEIDSVHAIRPGDLMQWWAANDQGHTVIVHQVRTSAGVLNSASDANDPMLRTGLKVDAVSVLGSHTSHASFNE
ncbi:MAG: hypothetical protein AAFV53_41820, partial [Myxococcota bacterium]